MKKILALLVVTVLLLTALTACGSKSSSITIAVPNDATNEARALLLLQDNGYIKLKDGAGITATINDIASQQVADYITETYGGAVVSVVENPGNGYDDSVDYDALAGTTITVAATPTPHAEVLAVAKEILAAKDITLDIKEFTDYVQPNNVVESGEIDANYFQHVPYLDDFNAENGTHLVSVLVVHVEPMGLYGGKQTSLDALNK